MSKTIYKFSRHLAFILSIVSSIILFNQGYHFRALGTIILLILFIITSHLYQKRYNIIATPYLFIYINLYIVFSLVASYYNCAKIKILDPTGFQNWEKYDYYPIYFFGVFFTYILIIIYLKFSHKKKNIKRLTISITKKKVRNIYIGIIFTIIAYFAFGRNEIFIIPSLAIIIILAIIDKSHRKIHVCFIFISLLIFRSIIFSRFYFIQIALPVIISYLIISQKNEHKFSIFKMYFYFGIGITCVLLYGIVSELVKLNTNFDGHYKISSIIFSIDQLEEFSMRQIYRLFIVWIKDGGYIIYHISNNGYYYGLTYIKPIAEFLNLPYINLPEIAARYNYSTYSQTGLLVEGYANFGIIGSIINIILVFFIMEFLRKRFVRKPSIMTISFMTIPFTKILLDGGSINSCIAIIGVLIVIYCFNILSSITKQLKNFCIIKYFKKFLI